MDIFENNSYIYMFIYFFKDFFIIFFLKIYCAVRNTPFSSGKLTTLSGVLPRCVVFKCLYFWNMSIDLSQGSARGNPKATAEFVGKFVF